MKKTMWTMVVIVAAGMLPGGCMILDDMLAEAAVDSVDLAQNENALSLAAVEVYDGAMTPEEVARASVENAGTFYQPAGCLTAVIEGQKVTYTLNDCTGPFGLVHITGTVEAIYSPALDGIRAEMSGTGLLVNQATLNLDAEALLTFDGAGRTLTVSSRSTGYGPRGHSIVRNGESTLTWNFESACMGLDGDWTTRVEDKSWSTEVTGFERCAGTCPEAGARIRLHGGIRNVTITIDFDGSDTASWKSSRGGSGQVLLLCGM